MGRKILIKELLWKVLDYFSNKHIMASLNTIIVILYIFVIFVFTSLHSGYDDTILEKIKVNFGWLNTKKMVTFTLIIFILLFIFTYFYQIIRPKRSSDYLVKLKSSYQGLASRILMIIIYIFIMLAILFYLPRHCAFGLTSNKIVKEDSLSKKGSINFFAIGDIQNTHAKSNIDDETNWGWRVRLDATKVYIKAINDLVIKLKNNDYSNIDVSHTGNIIGDVFKKQMKSGFVGLVSPGDCSQYGSDGRMFTTNAVGFYEYGFGVNPEDGGLLSIPSYECLGNHDYDVEGQALYADGNPMKEMQLRRNKYRKYVVNKDEHGNYSCDWGKLHMIFLNVWPSTYKLVGGNPEGSLEFLSADLKMHGHKKWGLVTHYIPRSDDFKKYFDNKGQFVMADFDKIFKQYKNNCIGGFYGHVHLKSSQGFYIDSKTGLKLRLLAGPAGLSDSLLEHSISQQYENQLTDIDKVPTTFEIPIFCFDQETEINHEYLIEGTKTGRYISYKLKTPTIHTLDESKQQDEIISNHLGNELDGK